MGMPIQVNIPSSSVATVFESVPKQCAQLSGVDVALMVLNTQCGPEAYVGGISGRMDGPPHQQCLLQLHISFLKPVTSAHICVAVSLQHTSVLLSPQAVVLISSGHSAPSHLS